MKKIILSLLVVLGTAMTSFGQYYVTSGDYGSSGGTSTGYKGVVDLGYVVDLSDVGAGRLELTTTHGYQVNQYFFVGAGLGLDYYTDAECIGVPLFADVRITPMATKHSPFFDVRLGYSVGDVSGFHFAPTFGWRFGLTDRIGMHLGLGYVMQGAEIYYDGYYDYTESELTHGLSIKVGIDF